MTIAHHHVESPGCAACALSAAVADMEAAEPPATPAEDPYSAFGAGDEMAFGLTNGFKNRPADSPPLGDRGRPAGRTVIRGATMVDGTGAPPLGPVDIVIEQDRIAEVRSVGVPGVPISNRRPTEGDVEIDAEGMYVLPGFIDAHAHIGFPEQSKSGPLAPTDYVYKLWLAHGVTTVREVGSFNGLRWTLAQAAASRAGEIAAPDIVPYAFFPLPQFMHMTPESGREWVREVAEAGAVGVKFMGAQPEVMQAALEEAKAAGLTTACHHAQNSVARLNALDSARWGLTSMEHWYGLPEALFDDRTVQDYPAHYNYNNEQDRFLEAGRLWLQAAEPGSSKWNQVMDELLELDFTIVPTFGIYEATRDEMRARRQEWHDTYTWPGVWDFYQPGREAHGSFFFDWTTQHEVTWRKNYQRWMQFINEFHVRGGRVCAGSDSGFIYNLYGFGFIRELELLQEAGLHPLEAIRAATLRPAELIGCDDEIGTIQTGKRADLVIVDGNPVANTKLLFGTGARRLEDSGEVSRTRGVRWTIKAGVLHDAHQLLDDVRHLVDEERERRAHAAD